MRGNGKISTFGLMILLTSAVVSSVSAQTKAWSITDYVKNLPENYITASGDFEKPSVKTIVVDEKNGYAAGMNSEPHTNPDNPPFPIFEMALFKSQTKSPYLVVSNMKSDPVCTDYETFFLRRVSEKWTEVKREVLPPLDLKMFWDAPQSAERLLKLIKRNFIAYNFEPPRRGTQMKVFLEICYRIPGSAPDETAQKFEKLIKTAKPIHLDWDKQTGKFKFVK